MAVKTDKQNVRKNNFCSKYTEAKVQQPTHMILCVGFTTTGVQPRFYQLRFYHLMLSANHPMHSLGSTELLKRIMVLSLNQNFLWNVLWSQKHSWTHINKPRSLSVTIRERLRAAPVAPSRGHVTGRVNWTLDLISDKLFVHSVTEYFTEYCTFAVCICNFTKQVLLNWIILQMCYRAYKNKTDLVHCMWWQRYFLTPKSTRFRRLNQLLHILQGVENTPTMSPYYTGN